MDAIPTADVIPISQRFERWRESLVAESPVTREVFRLATQIAPTHLPVLLHGETGTGKDIVARLIHGHSGRRGRLVPFNCAAVPASLAENELFGHAKGAFTGAEAAHHGLFTQANHGTLLLDEVGELDPAIQAKVLRVIEDGQVRPIGAASAGQVDVRMICATHRDLPLMVDQSRFREDLYHRLAGVALKVPPLRERREDITPLSVKFLAEAAPGGHRRIAIDALDWLVEREWPGNIRELRQTVHRAVALGGEVLAIDDFTRLEPRRIGGTGAQLDTWMLGKSWLDIEVEVTRWAIARYGSIRQAAIALRCPHSTLADRVKRLGLDHPTRR